MSWGKALESAWASASKSARQRCAKVIPGGNWIAKLDATPAARVAAGALSQAAKNYVDRRVGVAKRSLGILTSVASLFTNQKPNTICIPCLLGNHPFRDAKGLYSAAMTIGKASKIYLKHARTESALWFMGGIYRTGALGAGTIGRNFGPIFRGSFKRLLGSVRMTAVLGAVADIGDEALRQYSAGKFELDKLLAHGATGAAKSVIAGYAGAAAGAAASAAVAGAIVAGATAPVWVVPVAAAVVTIGVGYAVGKGLDWLDKKYKLTDHLADGIGWLGNKAKDVGSDMLRKTRRFFGRGGDSG